MLALPSGRLVRGRGLRRPLPDGALPEFGLSLLGTPPAPMPWDMRWLRWPDFRLPADQHHPWLLRQLPPRPDRVLDVGCGSGRLACILVSRAVPVDALDRSSVMLERARCRCAEAPNLTWLEGDLLAPAVPLSGAGYDAITAVSSLHHRPLLPALQRLAGLVRPGGVLAVVGHYRPDTTTDRALELVSLPVNAAVGAALALRGRAGKPDDEGMPVLAPTTTLADAEFRDDLDSRCGAT